MAQLILNSSTSDGQVGASWFNEDGGPTTDYGDARSGNPTGWGVDTSATTIRVGQYEHSGAFDNMGNIWQGFIDFDTSALRPFDKVTSITFSMYVPTYTHDGTSFYINARAKDWGTSVGTEDWDTTYSGTRLAYSETIGSNLSNTWLSFTSDNLSAINKGGETRLVLLSNRTEGNNRPGTGHNRNEWVDFSSSDATNKPTLTINYLDDRYPQLNTTTTLSVELEKIKIRADTTKEYQSDSGVTVNTLDSVLTKSVSRDGGGTYTYSQSIDINLSLANQTIKSISRLAGGTYTYLQQFDNGLSLSVNLLKRIGRPVGLVPNVNATWTFMDDDNTSGNQSKTLGPISPPAGGLLVLQLINSTTSPISPSHPRHHPDTIVIGGTLGGTWTRAPFIARSAQELQWGTRGYITTWTCSDYGTTGTVTITDPNDTNYWVTPAIMHVSDPNINLNNPIKQQIEALELSVTTTNVTLNSKVYGPVIGYFEGHGGTITPGSGFTEFAESRTWDSIYLEASSAPEQTISLTRSQSTPYSAGIISEINTYSQALELSPTIRPRPNKQHSISLSMGLTLTKVVNRGGVPSYTYSSNVQPSTLDMTLSVKRKIIQGPISVPLTITPSLTARKFTYIRVTLTPALTKKVLTNSYSVNGTNADNYMNKANADWSVVRQATADTIGDEGWTWYGLQLVLGPTSASQIGICFDTSAIPDNYTIDNARIILYDDTQSPSNNMMYMYVKDYNWGSTLTTSDWITGDNAYATIGVATSMVNKDRGGVADGVANGTVTFPLTSFNSISKTGTDYFVIIPAEFESATAPTISKSRTFSAANTVSPANQKPKLIVSQNRTTYSASTMNTTLTMSVGLQRTRILGTTNPINTAVTLTASTVTNMVWGKLVATDVTLTPDISAPKFIPFRWIVSLEMLRGKVVTPSLDFTVDLLAEPDFGGQNIDIGLTLTADLIARLVSSSARLGAPGTRLAKIRLAGTTGGTALNQSPSKPLSGTSNGESSASASLASHITFEQTIDGTSSASGSISIDHPLTGESTGQSATYFTLLSINKGLSGQSNGNSGRIANLGVNYTITGQSDGTSDSTDLSFKVTHGLNGTTDGTSTVSPLYIGINYGITANSSGDSTAASSMQTLSALSGNSNGLSTTSSSLSNYLVLTGQSQGNTISDDRMLQINHGLFPAIIQGLSTTNSAFIKLIKGLGGISSGTSNTTESSVGVNYSIHGISGGTSTITAQLRALYALAGQSNAAALINELMLNINHSLIGDESVGSSNAVVRLFSRVRSVDGTKLSAKLDKLYQSADERRPET